MIFVNPIVAPIFCKNAPDVIIRSDYEHTITVTVSCGDDSWDFDLQPSLSSDGDGYRAVIRMKELLQSVVRVPSVSVSQSEPLPIVTIVADNGEEEVITMSFVAAYGGAAGRSPREVLGQWLSWKDQVSKTYSWARETLVFFAGLNLTSWASGFYVVSAKVFFKDGTSEDVEIETGNLQETDQYISVAAGLSDISSLISSTGVITAYDVRFSLSGTTATGLSQSIDGYPQRFIVSRNDIRAREFIFRNSFGLEDRVFASGTEDLQLEGDTFSFINNGIEQELYNDAKEQREVRSGYISTPRGIALWIDFLKADNRFLFDSVNRLREIVVDSFDTDITENSIGSVSFVYHLSEQSAGRFFNPGDRVLSDYMPPTAIGALFVGNTPVPEEEIPAEDLFFLKTRLDEFPTADISEDTLILTQTVNGNWGKIAVTQLIRQIQGYHTHSNKSVLDEITQDDIDKWNAGSGAPSDHSSLKNRNLPDQHSISAITGLSEELAAKADASVILEALAGKVDKVSGKGLSTNDFTNAYKNILDTLGVPVRWGGVYSSLPAVMAGGTQIVLTNGKEYISNGTEWVEMGDENSYALKTTTINGKSLAANIVLGRGDFNDIDSDLTALETGKADKATTLAGYGIGNAYTKGQTDNLIATAIAALDSSKSADAGYALSGITITNGLITAMSQVAIPTLQSLMGNTAIGGTSSYIYWNGSAWKTKALGTAAFNNASDFLGATATAVAAQRLSGDTPYTIWGQTFWQNGKPKGNITGALTGVTTIDASGDIHSDTGVSSDGYLSARTADVQAGVIGSGGLDIEAMWAELRTSEYNAQKIINAVHIPLLAISKVDGLQAALNNKADASALSSYALLTDLDGYLPLSGGTLTSASQRVLDLRSESTTEVYVRYVLNNVHRAAVGYRTDMGAYLYTYTSGRYLGIMDDGTPHYNGHTLLHTSNYSSYALPLSGGTLKSDNKYLFIINSTNTTGTQFTLQNNGTNRVAIEYNSADAVARFINQISGCAIGVKDNGAPVFYDGGYHTLYHGGNLSTLKTDLGLGTRAYDNTEYLPLTGGTLSGNLTMSGTARIILEKGLLALDGVFLADYANAGAASQHNLAIFDGSVWHQAIHSGNIGSQSVANADAVDGYHASGFFRIAEKVRYDTGISISQVVGTAASDYSWNKEALSNLKLTNSNNCLSFIVGGAMNDRNAIIQAGHDSVSYAQHYGNLYLNKFGGNVYIGTTLAATVDSNVASASALSCLGRLSSPDVTNGVGKVCYFLASSSMTTNKPSSDGHILSFGWDTSGGWTSQLFLSASTTDSVQARFCRAGTWGSWRTLAFTDSNVASATKLQTSRSIWGQPFDGTADIGTDAAATMPYLSFTGSDNYIGLGQYGANNNLFIYAAANNIVRMYSGGAEVMRLNANGNVLIGTTTDNGADKLQVNGSIRAEGGISSNSYISARTADVQAATLTT